MQAVKLKGVEGLQGQKPLTSTQLLARRRRRIVLLWAIGAMISIPIICVAGIGDKSWVAFFGCICALLLVHLLVDRQLNHWVRRARQAERGAFAEGLVTDLLEALGPNHLVFSDIPTGHGNIDHCVLRSDGALFLIETKSHGGEVRKVNGQLRMNGRPLEQDFVSQALSGTFWMRDQIESLIGFKPWIHTAIVFTNAHVEAHLEFRQVRIFNARHLLRWLEGNPPDRNVAEKLWPRRHELRHRLNASITTPGRVAFDAAA